MRKKLNDEILNLFQVKLTDMMTPFDNGDFLRLPTEKEFFGENYYGEYESLRVKQWKPTKMRRNCMVFDGSKDENLQRYWLMNNVREFAYHFACISNGGYANYNGTSLSWHSLRFQNQKYGLKEIM